MRTTRLAAAAALAFALPVSAQDEPQGAPSPNEIVAKAAPREWIAIAPDDLLVMTLAPSVDGSQREVVIQLLPAPFSQGWIENIRTLARAQWYDGISVNRVQDNYVVQWGDPGYDNPESGEVDQKALPEGLRVMGEADYEATGLLSISDPRGRPRINYGLGASIIRNAMIAADGGIIVPDGFSAALREGERPEGSDPNIGDVYSDLASFVYGWPIGGQFGDPASPQNRFWPVHCYGMVGVGRNYSPDTGSGAELYTVIGHAPRHLDRNIALVGRIISGMEHLSSLPRGSGALGFYTEEEADKRVPILSVRFASELPEAERPSYEYLSTEGETFARYAEARANRRDRFFIQPAGGADICNIPVPIRETSGD